MVIEFIKNFFGRQNTILCPMCQAEVSPETTKCPSCQSEIPDTYRRNAHIKSITLPIIGIKNHGKTIFLQALFHTLEEMSDRENLWSDLTIEGANPLTREWISSIRTARAANQAPLPTGTDQEHPTFITILGSMPLWGDRILILRDVPGEFYDGFTFTDKVQTEFCKRSASALLVFDVKELDTKPQLAMDTMLQGYIRSLEATGSKVRGEMKKLIVVISKTDILRDKLPANLNEYVDSCPVRQSVDADPQGENLLKLSTNLAMSEYEASLVELDHQIRNWVKTLRGGNRLLSLAKRYDIELRFTLTSGWGQDPDRGTEMKPKRILDPFVWLLRFYSTEGK